MDEIKRVRAKFKVSSVLLRKTSRYNEETKGYDPAVASTIELRPVTGTSDYI